MAKLFWPVTLGSNHASSGCRVRHIGRNCLGGRVVVHAATYLGIGIASLLNILTPDVVILGGGVMQSWQLFQPGVDAMLKERAGMPGSVHIQVLPAALGLDASITGA